MVDIIKKPIITEKSEQHSEKYNRYTFQVDKNATKPEIKKAIELLYDVKVKKINTAIQGGGKKEMKYTKQGVIYQKNKAIKKAFITLEKGDEIDFYGNV